ncbi:MAG: thiolase [Chloroflexi bacterium]|nr:thiolase [Chloroflexota bacterium]|tara:strand:- start:1834 stop:2979 length:1146 start_codon:yes stop_codon:yes gene_type:complete
MKKDSTRVAIIGASETSSVGHLPNYSMLQLHAEAARLALDDAGLTFDDVDGLATAGATPAQLTEYFNIMPHWIDGTSVGGGSFLMHVSHAVAAIQAGHCNVALITHGESGRSRVGINNSHSGPSTIAGQFELPYGVWGPPSMFSIPIVRHMHEYGTTEEQLASVAVATRQWANLNPRAMMRDLISVDDVLKSRLIAWPLHLLNCCLVTDGGGALVLVGEEIAHEFAKEPVWVLGRGETTSHMNISMMEDMSSWTAAKQTGNDAFAIAEVTHNDIQHAMLYDAFTHVPIYALEGLGFVNPGEGGPYFAEGHTAPGGNFPVNTNGGGLSYTHTGMYGMFAIQESVTQLRGEAEQRQVDDLEISLVHAPAGMFSGTATLILGNK